MDRSDAEELVERYKTLTGDALRLAVWYEGDGYDRIYVRDDVESQYSPEEFEEKVKQLVVEGLSDPPNQEVFRFFGEMGAVVHRFERAIMLHFPVDEFTGLAVTIDRDDATSIDSLVNMGAEQLGSDSSAAQ